MTMSPRLRKFALMAHVTSSVGWTGAVAAFLALGIIGTTTKTLRPVTHSSLGARPTDIADRDCPRDLQAAGSHGVRTAERARASGAPTAVEERR